MLNPDIFDSPCANTVQGLLPAPAVMINDSPKPNKAKPRHKINTVSIRGLKFKGLSELHLVSGTDLIANNFIYNLLIQDSIVFVYLIWRKS